MNSRIHMSRCCLSMSTSKGRVAAAGERRHSLAVEDGSVACARQRDFGLIARVDRRVVVEAIVACPAALVKLAVRAAINGAVFRVIGGIRTGEDFAVGGEMEVDVRQQDDRAGAIPVVRRHHDLPAARRVAGRPR